MARSPKTSKPKPSKDTAKTKGAPVEDAVIIEESAPAPADEAGADTSESPILEGEDASKDSIEGADDAESPVEASTESENVEASAPMADAETENADPIATPSSTPEPARSAAMGVIPLLVGGLAAGFIGFVIARYAEPEAEIDPNALTPAQISQRFAEQAEAIDGLRGAVAPLASSDALEQQSSALSERLDATAAQLDGLSEQIASLEEQVATLALRPVATGIEADAFDGELSAFREQLDAAISTARTEIVAAQAEAEQISKAAFATEQSAALRAALAAVETAAVSGAPYADPLAEIAGLASVNIPAVLTANAEGAPTLSQLQDSFPGAARQALAETVIADPNDAPLARIGAFLRAQTGARSLAPREGEDPDAILSRAEAALRSGDVALALSEVDALPQEGQAAMGDWIENAQTSQQLQDALAALRQSLSVN